MAKLDVIANTVARANVHDPAAFKATLDAAVAEYVANVKALQAVAPADLQAGLERVEGDVQQFRFDAALTDRTALDAYAARECGRVATTPTAPTTVPVLGSTTSVAPTGATPTTNALGSTASTPASSGD